MQSTMMADANAIAYLDNDTGTLDTYWYHGYPNEVHEKVENGCLRQGEEGTMMSVCVCL